MKTAITITLLIVTTLVVQGCTASALTIDEVATTCEAPKIVTREEGICKKPEKFSWLKS